MKRVVVGPHRVYIAAPMGSVLDAFTLVDSSVQSTTGRGISLLSSHGPRKVIAVTQRSESQITHVVKEVIVRLPDRVTSRHLSGPFRGAREEAHLVQVAGGTDLSLKAELQITDESSYRLLALSFEQDVEEELQSIKIGAESRNRPLTSSVAPETLLVAVPIYSTEHELLAAIDVQEEQEWGQAGHGKGVAHRAVQLANMVMLPARQIEHLRRAARLHDAGKLALSRSLWGIKVGLTADERDYVDVHPQLGYDLAARVGMPDPVLQGILHHHERWDGHGYPDRLAGDRIQLRDRILALAEVMDSLLRTSKWRPALSKEQVIATLEAGSGQAWDPVLTRGAIRLLQSAEDAT